MFPNISRLQQHLSTRNPRRGFAPNRRPTPRGRSREGTLNWGLGGPGDPGGPGGFLRQLFSALRPSAGYSKSRTRWGQMRGPNFNPNISQPAPARPAARGRSRTGGAGAPGLGGGLAETLRRVALPRLPGPPGFQGVFGGAGANLPSRAPAASPLGFQGVFGGAGTSLPSGNNGAVPVERTFPRHVGGTSARAGANPWEGMRSPDFNPYL